MVGRTLKRYRLIEQVGQGGMAVVYRGVDESLERDVAVKLLHPHLSARPEHRRRLAREAKAVARLQHPNILEIFDFSGEESDEAFLVTELIRGPTLKAFAQNHPFSPPELASACVHELAGALAHAHAHGIVHRDLKPENVMIQEAAPQPTVKLMDFGIAQIIDRDDKMTITGSLMGSPAHMAPEIIDGQEADERSDVFSLGTILYWLVTGTLPFEGNNPGALLKKILEGDFADPRTLKPDVSDSLARVIADALARDPARRIPSAAEFQRRLKGCLEEAGLDRPADLLAEFFLGPEHSAAVVRDRVIEHLMKQGDDAALSKKTGKALSAYGRVIAIAPGTPQAGAARTAIDRLNSRLRWRRRLIATVAIVAGVGLVGAVQQPVRAWIASRQVNSTAPHPAIPQATLVHAAPPVELRTSTMKAGPARVDARPPPQSPHSIPATRPLRRPYPRLPTTPRVKETALVASTATELSSPPSPSAEVPFTVTAYPWGTLSIDHKQVDERTRPYHGEVSAGPHLITIEQACCEPYEARLNFDPRQPPKPLDVRLLPRPARITILAPGAPPDAAVQIGDRWATPGVVTPFGFQDEVYSRDVVVKLYVAGTLRAQKTITLEAGQTKTITLAMQPQ